MKKPRFPGGAKLKALREALDWKIDRAAVNIGISRPALENLEKGKNWPSAKTLAKLAAVYGQSMESLLSSEPTETR